MPDQDIVSQARGLVDKLEELCNLKDARFLVSEAMQNVDVLYLIHFRDTGGKTIQEFDSVYERAKKLYSKYLGITP